MQELQDQLDEIARTPVLLLATDFDGTLAPIANEPSQAEAHRESIVALKALAAMPQTHVAIISGRSLASLAKHVAEIEDSHLVGSHGSEYDAGFAMPVSPEAEELLRKTRQLAHQIAGQTPGTLIEDKPAGVAFHYRNAGDGDAAAAVEQLLNAVK